MPLFEYRCGKCSRTFSLLVGMTAEKAKKECPHCGGRKLAKLISRPARIVRSEDSDSDLGPEEGDFSGDMGDDFGDDEFDEE